MTLDFALTAFVTILTQLVKQTWPEFVEKFNRYLPVVVVVLGMLFGGLVFIGDAMVNPVPAENGFQFAWLVIQQLLSGALSGLASVGLYSAANQLAPTHVPNLEAVLANREEE